MDNPLSDLGDKAFEQLEHTVGTVKRDIIKGIPQTAKQQIAGTADKTRSLDAARDKKDPVTGKPVPSKKILTQLTQATAQLAQAKLKKVREELARQKLKTSQTAQTSQVGPEIKEETPKPKEDIVAKTLKGSKSTGEFKGLIGG